MVTRKRSRISNNYNKIRTSLEWSTYRAWINMKTRCSNPNATRYYNYGGRGITICDRWNLFDNFLSDLGVKPTHDHTLDRINNEGNYEPSNCRWATQREQQNNRYNNRKKHPNGKTKPIPTQPQQGNTTTAPAVSPTST